MKACHLIWAVLFLCSSLIVHADAPDHLVISEIQIGGVTTKDEFVELFNPTPSPVNVDGWKLTKKTAGGSENNLLSSSKFPDFAIPAYGFFLIVHPDYQGAVVQDVLYSAASNSIASNNTVLLYNAEGAVVDKVGLGDATDFETAATVNPDTGTCLVRLDVLLASGAHGPAQDTDNNAADFQVMDTPSPQNSDVALPVSLLTSQAYWASGGMKLEWKSLEEDVVHWHIWRTDQENGVMEQITQEPIRMTDAGGYEYLDETAVRGQMYFYVLESFDQAGSSSQSPVFSSNPLLIRNRTLATTWGHLKRR